MKIATSDKAQTETMIQRVIRCAHSCFLCTDNRPSGLSSPLSTLADPPRLWFVRYVRLNRQADKPKVALFNTNLGQPAT